MPSVSRFSAGAALACAVALVAPAGAAAVLALAPTPAVAQAKRDQAAEAFVQSQAGRVFASLKEPGAPAAKRRTFETLMNDLADIPRITDFVLGKYNRTITPAQKQQFAGLFRRFVVNIYESRLGEYRDENLKVTGSTVRQPGDVIVTSRVGGGQLKQPMDINWRVLKGSDGRWRAVDMQIMGVWLAITQQQDFVSSIDNAGGNIAALIKQLQTQVAQQEASRS